MINRVPAGWVAVARDTFEYNMRPWVGRRYEKWLRDALKPHPVDPQGQVLVPPQIHEVFKKRRHFTPATTRELAAAGYPKLPRDPLPETSDVGNAAMARREAPARHPGSAVPQGLAA